MTAGTITLAVTASAAPAGPDAAAVVTPTFTLLMATSHPADAGDVIAGVAIPPRTTATITPPPPSSTRATPPPSSTRTTPASPARIEPTAPPARTL